MGTFIFVTLPLSYAYYKFSKKVLMPVVEGIIDGTIDAIKEAKAKRQAKENEN